MMAVSGASSGWKPNSERRRAVRSPAASARVTRTRMRFRTPDLRAALRRRGCGLYGWRARRETRRHLTFPIGSPMRVLGLETTCDETAAAVVALRRDGRGEILASEVLSQIAEHAP